MPSLNVNFLSLIRHDRTPPKRKNGPGLPEADTSYGNPTDALRKPYGWRGVQVLIPEEWAEGASNEYKRSHVSDQATKIWSLEREAPTREPQRRMLGYDDAQSS